MLSTSTLDLYATILPSPLAPPPPSTDRGIALLTPLELLLDPLLTALLIALALSLALVSSTHLLLHKEQARAAAGWLGVIWIAPFLGPTLYAIFGINRIQRTAIRLRSEAPQLSLRASPYATHIPEQYRALVNSVDRIVNQPLTAGNQITLLRNGDQAYPPMLQAIAEAEHSVALCTYIFDMERWGTRFADALVEAQARGVEVRVLIDGVGSLYSRPNAIATLRRRGVHTHPFLLSVLPWHLAYLNLRNHRKIMVVDGKFGFTGGTNIRDHHVLGDSPAHPTADLHFSLRGPVVRQLMRAFSVDWAFTCGEALGGPAWFPDLEPVGSTLARAIPDGPDEDFERAQWTLIAGLACAKERVQIITPYFLPEEELIGVLNATALRGVQVDVILPASNNLAYLTWATSGELIRILPHGVRVWICPGPFDHGKLIVVDGHWVMFGSANIDPRSLRLNFEFNVEAYDEDLGRRCEEYATARMEGARLVTLNDLEARPFWIKMRDGVARLFKPYL